MTKNRLEAFSDGVIAIIITIMVLELKVPHGGELTDLFQLFPVFLSYVLSFVYIGIYWNNHHHLFQIVKQIDGKVMWANLHLLFWLSLTPLVTAWAGENHFSNLPVALYGFVLFMSAMAYFILTKALLGLHGSDSLLSKALGADFKGKLSLIIYAVAILAALWRSWIAIGLYFLVAIIWFVPDRRIIRALMSYRVGKTENLKK